MSSVCKNVCVPLTGPTKMGQFQKLCRGIGEWDLDVKHKMNFNGLMPELSGA